MMKCWTCGKEESNMDLKINVDRLIWATRNHFETETDYHTTGKKLALKPYWKWTKEEGETYIRREREQSCRWDEISDICGILNIDYKKLYTIARLARKWEQKRKWQYCFPTQEQEQRILQYLLVKADPFTGPNINYIHWNINNKAEKAAKKAA
jgi:hypothetical protein